MTAKNIIAGILIVMGIFQSAAAQTKQRAINQHQRIRQGMKSGEITHAERLRIAKQERDVRQEVRQAKADGTVTCSEKRDIRKEQRQASRTIYRTKHNNRSRN